MSGALIVKHWAGELSVETEKGPDGKYVFSPALSEIDYRVFINWAIVWQKKVTKAKNEGKTLLVFEVPDNCKMELVTAMERFLQTQIMK